MSAPKFVVPSIGKSCDWRKSMLWLISNQSQCSVHCNCTQIPFLVKDWREITHNTFPWKGLTVDLYRLKKGFGADTSYLVLIYIYVWVLYLWLPLVWLSHLFKLGMLIDVYNPALDFWLLYIATSGVQILGVCWLKPKKKVTGFIYYCW